MTHSLHCHSFIHSVSQSHCLFNISLQSGKQNSNCNRENKPQQHQPKYSHQKCRNKQNSHSNNNKKKKKKTKSKRAVNNFIKKQQQQQQQLENYAHKKKLYKKHVNKPRTSSNTETERERGRQQGCEAGIGGLVGVGRGQTTLTLSHASIANAASEQMHWRRYARATSCCCCCNCKFYRFLSLSVCSSCCLNGTAIATTTTIATTMLCNFTPKLKRRPIESKQSRRSAAPPIVGKPGQACSRIADAQCVRVQWKLYWNSKH